MQTPLAITASLLAILLWLLSRRRPTVSPSLVAASQVRDAAGLVVTAATSAPPAEPAMQATGPCNSAVQQSRGQRLQSLATQLKGTPEQRLLALVQLSGWGDRAALPLLKRALRDPHLQVMGAAAAAIDPYRVHPATTGRPVVAVEPRLPRNAAPGTKADAQEPTEVPRMRRTR